MSIDPAFRDAAAKLHDQVSDLPIPEFEPKRSSESRGAQLALGGAMATLLLVVGLLVAAGGDGSGTSEPDAAAPELAIAPAPESGVAAPHDGVDSIGLPVSADPNVGLVDGQQIMVYGSGFPANTQVGIVQCSPHMAPLEGIARCMTSTFGTTSSDHQGEVAATFTVNRYLHIGDTTIDCASAPPEGFAMSCNVAVGALDDYDVSGTGALYFDPDAPGTESMAELVIGQVDDLVDYQLVTLTIHDPGAGVRWHVNQCVAQTNPGYCGGGAVVDPTEPDYPAVLVSDDGSDITTMVAARRIIGDTDCGREPQACSIVVQAGGTNMMRSHRISFRPGSPLATASLEVMASSPVASGGPIEVAITHRAPGQLRHPVMQCAAGESSLDRCVPVGSPDLITATGARGEIWPAMTVDHANGTVDCSVEGACVLRLVDSDGSVAAETPITVRP